MEIKWGKGGWVRVDEIGLPGPLFVRYMADGSVGELFLAAEKKGAGITAGDLRRLPLAKVSAVALGRRDRFQPEDPGAVDVWAELSKAIPRVRYRTLSDDVRLAPPTRGLDDDFLRRVADAYLAAVRRGERPNQALAAQAMTPVRSVERWVYLARKRGFLAKAKRGGIA